MRTSRGIGGLTLLQISLDARVRSDRFSQRDPRTLCGERAGANHSYELARLRRVGSATAIWAEGGRERTAWKDWMSCCTPMSLLSRSAPLAPPGIICQTR